MNYIANHFNLKLGFCHYFRLNLFYTVCTMSLDFEFITALKTRFSGHLLGALLRSQNQKYPSVLSQNCLETLRTALIEVREDSTGCSTWTALSVQPKAENIQGFLICNPQCETIHLVKVDQCFFDNSHSARCDCLILAFHGKRKNLTVKCGASRRTLPS